MAKVVDITNKLSFEKNPCLVIKGRRIEINADAPTVLKVMSLLKDERQPDIEGAYNLIFTEPAKKEIEKLKICFKDLILMVQEAVAIIAGDASPGE